MYVNLHFKISHDKRYFRIKGGTDRIFIYGRVICYSHILCSFFIEFSLM